MTCGARGSRRWLALAMAVCGSLGCGRGSSSGTASAGTAALATSAPSPPGSEGEGALLPPIDPPEADEWARAAAGDEEALDRLVDRIGSDGVRERSRDPKLRDVALRAMGHCPDFADLPWLADVAALAGDGEAAAALAAIVDQASRPQRARDPDDAEELAEGCGKLLALARAKDAPKPRRVNAIRALRMLADRGCARRADVPTDLDAPPAQTGSAAGSVASAAPPERDR